MDAERVILTANENYTDSVVIPEGYIYASVPDQIVMAERFLAGELNVIEDPQVTKREDIRNDANVQNYEYSGRAWDYLSLNYADPDNPQHGVEVDENGEPVKDENGLPIIVEQDPHPIFGDVRVRRAIQLAINVDEIIEKATLGEGTVMAANELPTSWALNPDLQPVPHDPEAALALLADAGWTDSDGDGLLDKDGQPFSFELLTNVENARRTQIGELVQEQLAQIGIEVNFVTLDFNQLLEIQDSQTFDAVILGWRNGYPIDPDQTGIFTSDGDIVGSGFNSVSYTNPEIDRLMKAALAVPGCGLEDRAAIYHQIQEILQQDQPYVWLFAQNGFYAASNTVNGFNPYPNEMYWNADVWTITQ
jgi:ABC-type transport system substrate-binding protein